MTMLLLRPIRRLDLSSSRSWTQLTLLSVPRCRPNISSLRLNVRSASTAPAPIPRKSQYPEQLLIYHSGTGKTVFIGCLKVTTIFVFAFFGLVVAPSHYYSADGPTWISGVILLSGIIPMSIVAYTTRPFVTYIHLRLPPYARYSREFVHRYSMNLPPTASVDITTMSFIGKPRVSRMKVTDLYPVKSRLGVGNYARDTKAIDEQRSWWRGKSVGQFAVRGDSGSGREKGIWENVAGCIAKSSGARNNV